MTFQGDQQSIVVSESGSDEDGLVAVRATSTTALRGSTALRGLSSRASAPLPEGRPRNFGSGMANAMVRGFFRFLAVALFFRFIFRDLFFFCDKSVSFTVHPLTGAK